MGLGKIILGFFDGKWKRMLLAAALVLDDCAYCCNQHLPPTATCGSDATCNNFCDNSKKAYSRSECCVCPCPGRLDYPHCYSRKYANLAVKSGPILVQPDGSYFQVMGDGRVPGTTECGDNSFPMSVGRYAADGTLIDTPDFTAAYEAEDYSVAGTDQPGGTVQVTTIVYLIGGSGTGVEGVIGGFTSETTGLGPTVPICTGGTISDLGAGADLTKEYVGTGAGTVNATPKCTNCDNTPCNPQTDPASRCALPTFNANVQVGTDPDSGDPVYEPVSVLLSKDGLCGFSGTADIEGGSVEVVIAPDRPCVNDDHVNDGLIRWKTTVTAPRGIVVLEGDPFTVSACPTVPDSGSSDDGLVFINDASLDYGSDCGDRPEEE